MVIYATLATFAAAALSVSGVPVITLNKRIAQNIPDSTAKWEQACLAAGGGERCNPLSVAAFSTLLAAPPPCAQQDAADNMIDLAHQLNNDADMIRLTQIFRQQPRNAVSSMSTILFISIISHMFIAGQSVRPLLPGGSPQSRARWALPVPIPGSKRQCLHWSSRPRCTRYIPLGSILCTIPTWFLPRKSRGKNCGWYPVGRDCRLTRKCVPRQ
jgi:hypothetical protein